MALETRYAARRDWPVERLVESLSALLTVRRRPIARQRVTFLDTLDGRLGRAGGCLTLTADADGKRLEWRHGSLRVGCAVSHAIHFAWDIPTGTLRQRIESFIETRRLLPIAEAEHDGVLLDVMDETHKTFARLSIVAGRARASKRRSVWRPFQPFLTLNALRGYEGQCAGPIAIIESRPGLERGDSGLQGHVLRTIGASMPQDASVYRAELDPSIRADAGSMRMHRENWRIVVANLEGVLTGLDSECLRDFRVAARRSHTMLEQVQGALPQTEAEHFRDEFSWLRQITDEARDLDVLLADLRSGKSDLSEEGREAILVRLEQERARAQRRLVDHLKSERCLRLMDEWREFLAHDIRVAPGDGCGALPLVTLIAQRGSRLYQHTLSSIEGVSGDTPMHELHRIRVDVRKLRDLIEAASSLYDASDLTIVLRALGRLHSVLGERNHASVQADWLRRYAARLSASLIDAALVREAAESLADAADGRVEKLRKPVNQQLLRFGESSNRVAFERVFHIKHLTELVQ